MRSLVPVVHRIEEDFEAWLAERVDAWGCWSWLLSTHKGYGVTTEGKRTRQAHRVVWEHLVGAIPQGLQLDHLCKNRACVNPDHLDVVTGAENTRRGAASSIARSRRDTRPACAQGHLYTEANTYRRSSGHRLCKACVTERNRRRYA